MNLFVLHNRETGLFAARDCAGQHDGRFSDDVADAKEFHTFGDASDYGQNFDDNWHPVALFDDAPRSASFAPGSRNSDLDGHAFSGAVSAGDY